MQELQCIFYLPKKHLRVPKLLRIQLSQLIHRYCSLQICFGRRLCGPSGSSEAKCYLLLQIILSTVSLAWEEDFDK